MERELAREWIAKWKQPLLFYDSREARGTQAMKKSDLPTKTCVVCARPFTWRKKWAKVWDEVRYCSERCRRKRG